MVARNNILWLYWSWHTSIRLCIAIQVPIINLYTYAYMLTCIWWCKDACIQTSLCMVMFTEEASVARLSILPWILHWNVESVSLFLRPVLSYTVTPTAKFHLFHHYPPTSSGSSEIQFGSNTSADSRSICHFLMASLSSALNVLYSYFPNSFSRPDLLRAPVQHPVSLSNPSASYFNYSHSFSIEHFEGCSWDPLPNSFHYVCFHLSLFHFFKQLFAESQASYSLFATWVPLSAP